MLKNLVKRCILRLYPEIAAGLHLPKLAVVIAVPDPPAGGEICTEERPKYAVDCRLLKSDFTIDDEMPLMRDIPVALSGCAPDRGFALLPQPGTIVELAFAFGMQTHPYIRAVLPHNIKMPRIDARSMRWQQTAATYQQVDSEENWSRITPTSISDEAGTEISQTAGTEIKQTATLNIRRTASTGFVTEDAAIFEKITAPKIWIGSPDDNFLQIVSDFMLLTIQTFSLLQNHQHETPVGTSDSPSNKDAIEKTTQAEGAVKSRLEVIKL